MRSKFTVGDAERHTIEVVDHSTWIGPIKIFLDGKIIIKQRVFFPKTFTFPLTPGGQHSVTIRFNPFLLQGKVTVDGKFIRNVFSRFSPFYRISSMIAFWLFFTYAFGLTAGLLIFGFPPLGTCSIFPYGGGICARVLLFMGADPNISSKYTDTPLDIAIMCNRPDIVQMLLKAHADPNTCAKGGWTPLHSTAVHGFTEYAKILLANGANPNAKDKERGITPLHYAASNKFPEVMKILLTNGANPNARTKDNWTPLHGAVWAGSVECVQILLDHGGDINAKDDKGETPLRKADEYKHPEVVKILIEKGAKPDEQTGKGAPKGMS